MVVEIVFQFIDASSHANFSLPNQISGVQF